MEANKKPPIVTWGKFKDLVCKRLYPLGYNDDFLENIAMTMRKPKTMHPTLYWHLQQNILEAS